jgi:hypothetical protein
MPEKKIVYKNATGNDIYKLLKPYFEAGSGEEQYVVVPYSYDCLRVNEFEAEEDKDAATLATILSLVHGSYNYRFHSTVDSCVPEERLRRVYLVFERLSTEVTAKGKGLSKLQELI